MENLKRVPGVVVKLIWFIFNQARKWLTLVVFVFMLGFTVATHTVEYLANMTAQVIQVASGLIASNTDTKSRASPARSQTPPDSPDIKTRHRSAAPPIDADRRLDAIIIEELAQDKLSLESQSRLDQQEIASLRTSEATLQRRLNLMDTRIADQDARNVRMRQRSTDVLGRIQQRTQKTATVNVGSMFGEAIPIYGIAIVVGATTFEITSACDTMNDLYELQVELNPESAIPDDRDEVCGLQVPTRDEIWQKVKESPQAAWELSINGIGATTDWASNLETPDFAGRWARFMTWAGSFFQASE